MIYDCFNFFNEFDLLDIRLNTLWDTVDKFVLAESTVTFTNKKKPLYYLENKDKFKKYKDKIIHVVIDDSPNVSMPWIIENHQLSSVVRGLKSAKPQDTVLISCVDEIPKPKKIVQWKDKRGKHKVFLQSMCYYYLNYMCYNEKPWLGTQMYAFKDIAAYPNVYVARFLPPDVVIEDGGWHFSYMGGVAQIRKKLESFSHQEYNNEKYNTEDKIYKAILEGRDFLPSKMRFKITPDSFLPKYVQNNKEMFSSMLIDKDKLKSISSKKLLGAYRVKNLLRKAKHLLHKH